MDYKVIYPWTVMDELKNGSAVFVTDRTQKVVLEISCLEVSELVDLLRLAETEKTRIEFFKTVEREDEK